MKGKRGGIIVIKVSLRMHIEAAPNCTISPQIWGVGEALSRHRSFQCSP